MKVGDKILITEHYNCNYNCYVKGNMYTITEVRVTNKGYMVRNDVRKQCLLKDNYYKIVPRECTCGVKVCDNCRQYRGNNV